MRPANWVKVDWDTVEWLPFLNVMFWWVLQPLQRVLQLLLQAALPGAGSSVFTHASTASPIMRPLVPWLAAQELELLGQRVLPGGGSAQPQQDFPACIGRCVGGWLAGWL